MTRKGRLCDVPNLLCASAPFPRFVDTVALLIFCIFNALSPLSSLCLYSTPFLPLHLQYPFPVFVFSAPLSCFCLTSTPLLSISLQHPFPISVLPAPLSCLCLSSTPFLSLCLFGFPYLSLSLKRPFSLFRAPRPFLFSVSQSVSVYAPYHGDQGHGR